MRLMKLDELPRDALIELAKTYSRNWQSLDGLWFGAVEAEYGLEAAARLDLKNWARQSVTEAERIQKALRLGGGLESVLTVLSFMSWQLTSPLFVIEEESPERVVFSYRRCAVQEGRRKQGKPEFHCKPMKLTLLSNIARVAEPRAKVRCLNAPPDPRSGDAWCRWELRLR